MTAKSPMRILHVLGGLDRAGAETWLMHVLRHIDRDSFRFDFIVHTDRPGAYDDEVRALGGRVYPCLNYQRPLQYAKNFKAILREIGPLDVVHSHVHDYTGFVLRIAHQAGVPIRIAHSHLHTSLLEARAGVARRFYLRLMKTWLRAHATAGIAVSEKAAYSYFGPKWRNDRRWRLLYCGIDMDQFASDVDRDALRADLGIPRDAFVVGHVGRFDEQKNHTFLIDIFRELLKREPSAVLLSIGGGSLKKSIEQKAEQLGIRGRILFLENRPDVPRLMKGAMDVLAFPSHFEGLPLVLLETQAAGLPCLMSDTIAEETTVIPPLVRRFSLSQPARAWSEELLALRNAGDVPSATEARDLMSHSPFNIEVGVAALQSFYRSLMPQSVPPIRALDRRTVPAEELETSIAASGVTSGI
jgi:glycosyltransferase involved in cell wall biosynthesis